MKSLIRSVHASLFRLRYSWAARHWPVAETGSRPDMARVLLTGFVNEPFGVGRAAVLTQQALTGLGYAVETRDLRADQRRLLTRRPEPIHTDAGVWLIHANPPEARMALFAGNGGEALYRIGYWTWESDLAPADWLEVARWFHEIWVPSRYVADAFARAFTENGMAAQAAKLRVVPHPVPVPAKAPALPGGKVRVLTTFDPNSSFERKNPAGAIAAWRRAFPQATDAAELVIKTHGGAAGLPQYAALVAQAGGRPDIVFMAKTLPDVEQQALVDGCDILLSLHRSEGFGLALAEAMAAGKAVIATGGTGNADFMNDDNARLIPGPPVQATPLYNGPRARWLEPDIEAAAEALKALASSPDIRAAIGRRACHDMTDLYAGWSNAVAAKQE